MEKQHKQLGLKNLYFNRFLSIRYSCALFLFLNLYYAIFLFGVRSFMAILPLFILVFSFLVALEQVKLYRKHSNKLPFAQCFYWCVLAECLVLMLAVYSPLYSIFYPFLLKVPAVLNFLTVLILACLVIVILMLIKCSKIKRDKDKYFKAIKTYDEIIN